MGEAKTRQNVKERIKAISKSTRPLAGNEEKKTKLTNKQENRLNLCFGVNINMVLGLGTGVEQWLVPPVYDRVWLYNKKTNLIALIAFFFLDYLSDFSSFFFLATFFSFSPFFSSFFPIFLSHSAQQKWTAQKSRTRRIFANTRIFANFTIQLFLQE